jgi:hypothetical protein
VFNASLYALQLVVRYFCEAGFMRSSYQSFSRYAGQAWFVQQSHDEVSASIISFEKYQNQRYSAIPQRGRATYLDYFAIVLR